MSANFYDLLKYAATGQASPSMTFYDRMRASTLTGGAVQTLTGIPPLSFKSDGTPLISLSMLGNGQQTGTPSPDNIIMPTFCGVRTANLFDKNSDTINNIGVYRPGVDVAAGTYSISNGTTTAVYYRVRYSGTVVQINAKRTVENIVADDRLYVWRDSNVRTDGVMLNLGSTALPYEPYGYKIPITCAGQTVPVYLGQVSTVRRVKKVVLTGQERGKWSYNVVIRNGNGFYNPTFFPDYKPNSDFGYCTHYPLATAVTDTIGVLFGGNINFITDFSEGIDTADKWKSYLATQYANGTPVTIWYVLAKPETAIVNEPLAKIGTYADELHGEDAGVTIPTAKGQNTLTVDTPIQPSEMTITYRN